MVYIVSYDLRNPNRNYTSLYEELKNSPGWWHYLESTWLVSTTETATELYNRLVKKIDRDDSLLIIQAGTDRQGWLPEKAWDWIRTHIG
jgi:hypothetical protein